MATSEIRAISFICDNEKCDTVHTVPEGTRADGYHFQATRVVDGAPIGEGEGYACKATCLRPAMVNVANRSEGASAFGEDPETSSQADAPESDHSPLYSNA